MDSIRRKTDLIVLNFSTTKAFIASSLVWPEDKPGKGKYP
jgi:hypothetical protein